MRRTAAAFVVLGMAIAGGALTHTVQAQNAPAPGPGHGAGHTPHMAGMHGKSGVPTLPEQDAFAALAEVVRILEADPNTDWSTVDLERLRQHLIDMNEVVLRSAVKPTPVPGGLTMEITGRGRTEGAHHQPHHLAMARGQMPAGHRH
jgi:hypothetical protein